MKTSPNRSNAWPPRSPCVRQCEYHGGSRRRPGPVSRRSRPAAQAIAGQLGDTAMLTASAAETARLEAGKPRLTALLSEIPLATIMVGGDHRIVLYDAQAAELLCHPAPLRLTASIFDAPISTNPPWRRPIGAIPKSGNPSRPQRRARTAPSTRSGSSRWETAPDTWLSSTPTARRLRRKQRAPWCLTSIFWSTR